MSRCCPWNEIDTYLGSMLAVMDGFVVVWIVVVFLALSFGLVNTLVMAIFERVREIGLMLALGMTPRNILSQIVAESILLLVIGLAIGNVAAWATIEPLKDGIDVSIVGEGMEYVRRRQRSLSGALPRGRHSRQRHRDRSRILRQPVAGLARLPIRSGASHYKGVIMNTVRCIESVQDLSPG